MAEYETHRAGKMLQLGGYFTQAVFLHGQTGDALERRIGYHRGRLRDGWYLVYFEETPQAHQFELAGYSQLSGGIERGHLPENAGNPTVEEQAKAQGMLDVARVKTELARDTFVTAGTKRLAKVIPVGDHDPLVETPYPPGSGIPQWKLTKGVTLRGRVIGKFSYDQKWSGGYA